MPSTSSLYSNRLVGGNVFVGLQNYTQALQDSQFLSGLERIALFFVIQVPIMIVLSTIFALLLDSGRVRAPSIFRIAFFVPFAVPAVVAALMWGYLYGAKFGPFVQIAHDLGTASPQFLTSSHLLPSIANVVTWEFAGYNMIILYAALLSIPRDLYEAASIDGAGPTQDRAANQAAATAPRARCHPAVFRDRRLPAVQRTAGVAAAAGRSSPQPGRPTCTPTTSPLPTRG